MRSKDTVAIESMIANVSLRRLGQPEDIANTICIPGG